MVYRDGETIIFTPAEQQEFGALERLPANLAYELAVDYENMAQAYASRADGLIGETQFGSEQRQKALRHRAGRLDTISKRIYGLLGPEIIEATIAHLADETDES